MRTVVFDLDGTIADTGADLIAAANHCFQRLGHGHPLDPVTDKATAFRGGRAMLKLGFERVEGNADPVEIDRQFPILIDAYSAAIDTHTTLYPGCVDAVEVLLEAGYHTTICTNKPENLAELLLHKLGIRGLFGALVGADTLAVRKPDPEPYFEAIRRVGGNLGQSVLVGDTVTDHDTARAAGAKIILVTFGPEGDAVAAMKPDALLPAYDQLPMIVADLIG